MGVMYSFSARFWVFLAIAVLFSGVTPAIAQDASDIANELTTSARNLPGLVSAFAYLLGMLLGVWGVFKLKDHVDNPNNTPIHVPVIRLLAGGALLALPTVYEAMARAFGNPGDVDFDPGVTTAMTVLSGGLSDLANLTRGALSDLNAVMSTLTNSAEDLPGLIVAVAYLLGLILGFSGILKIKEHVENPDKAPLSHGVIRLLVGGALFSIEIIYQAMAEAFGDVGLKGQVMSVLSALNFFSSGYTGDVTDFCNPLGGNFRTVEGVLGEDGGGASLRDSFCGIILHAGAAPAFLNAIAYVIGLVLGVWGLLKIRDHVDNPQQNTIWAGVSRLLAGGAFFSLPIIVEVFRSSIAPLSSSAIGSGVGTAVSGIFGIGGTVTKYNDKTAPEACDGLDGIMYCMMSDVLGPLHVVINFFAFVAGTVLIMIGISRLIKSAQEGARGPGGFGTIMTFITGGALISYNELVRAFTMTMFSNPTTLTFVELSYSEGLSGDEVAAIHTVISAVIKFMIVIGLISFVRGLFIIRGVAEGNNQASLMAGVTHLVGGALAVNLGPLINAVQTTLGISAYGVTFS